MGILLSACNQKPDAETAHSDGVASTGTVNVIDELKPEPIKVFAAQPEDAADILALENFDLAFTEQSDAMELTLQNLMHNHQLTAQIEQQQKQSNIQAGIQQLQTLPLKTEQGRYIQNLWLQYWQNQQRILSQKDPSQMGQPNGYALGNNAGLSTYLHAQQQLKHWQQQQK